MSNGLDISGATQGWQQILTARQKMLNDFDVAKTQAQSHKITVSHGFTAEAAVREWLTGFLPKRYGVTAGYIISPGLSASVKAPHFDVIIYDQLESPVLWIEEHGGTSPQGRVLAIPVEYVKCVIEVKSALSATTLRDAIEKLQDLKPLMSGYDTPGSRYKVHLPPEFSCAPLFFELRQSEAGKREILEGYLEGRDLRGFYCGIVLRAEGHTGPYTGDVQYAMGDQSVPTTNFSTLAAGTNFSDSVMWQERHLMAFMGWYEFAFSRFAFDLIARMQGTYQASMISSFYGFGTSIPITPPQSP